MKKSTKGMTVAGAVLAVLSVIFMIVIIILCEGEGLAVGLIATGLFMVVGILLIVCEQLAERKSRKILEKGVKTEGVITGVEVDLTVAVNRRYPYKAICEVVDAETDEVYLYSSEPVFEDIGFLKGEKVDVYYMPDDRGVYFVDLDSALNRLNSSVVHDFR